MQTDTILSSRSGWTGKRLDEVCSQITDGSHFSPTPQATGRIIANVKDMRDGYIDLQSCTRISERDFLLLRSQHCCPLQGDVLLSKDGTIGRVVVYSQAEEIVALSSIAILHPASLVNSRFLGQALESDLFTQQLDSLKSGSALRRIVLRDIRALRIPLPSLLEQQRIAEILDTADEAIQRSEQLIAKLKQIKSGLLHDLLAYGLDENGQLRDPVAHPEQFKDSPLGRVPREWEICTLETICVNIVDCPHTTPIFRTDGVLISRTSDIRDGVFVTDFASRVSMEDYRKRIERLEPRPGDLVLAREAPVGEAFIVPDGMKMCLGQRTMLLRPNSAKVHPGYILAQIYSENMRARIGQIVSGTTNPHLNVKDVRIWRMPLPSLPEQCQIVSSLSAHDARLRAEEAYRDKLQQLKRGLMHDLLTGKVRVTA